MPSNVAGARARSRRPSPRERLLKAADELFYAEGVHTVGIDRVIERAALFARPGYHGCAFNRATAEAQPGSAAYEVPRAYRRWLRDFLRDLAAAADAPDPGLLAGQIHLLYDGAMMAASLDGDAGVTAASRAAAEG